MKPLINVLITSPSLDTFQNVSGISSLVSDIIARGSAQFIHLELGSKDGQRKDPKWMVSQVLLYLRMLYICLTRRVDIIHLNVGLEMMGIIRDYLLMVLGKVVCRKKLLLHLHGGFYLMHEPANQLLSGMLRGLIDNADLVVVLSELERETLLARYGPHNFQVLPNAVECQPPHTPVQRRSSEVKLAFVGRINYTKGIFVIAEALQLLSAHYHRFAFSIYGTGPELEPFVERLNACSRLDFTYRGVVKGAEKWQALHEADVLLLPSLHSEGMPMAILESMAARCVVISTADASISTVVHDGINGLLIPKADPQALAAKIREVLDGKVDCYSLADNAAAHIATHYTLSRYISKLQEVYAEVLLPATAPAYC